MGIPSYFRNITVSHPNIIKGKVDTVSELYLDLNCAIHKCCREIMSTSENIDNLEGKMINSVIDYIIKLYNYVNPTELLYIAIDGTAPRAKMVQQRLRRFKSIKEKKLKSDIEKKYNYKNNSINWDTNAITPGTIFMKKLSDEIKIKLSVKSLFNNDKLQVIFSDSNCPGEGEHKIFNKLKINLEEKNKFNIINNYVIYGLDADLIMLSLTCHSNNIYLIREQLEFNNTNIKEPYLFLDIGYLSDGILEEMISNNMNVNINKKWNIIDDYISLCFLLGNDFLPHIPSLEIRYNGLDILLQNYINTYNELEDFMICDNNINLTFLQSLLTSLLSGESKRFNHINTKIANYKWFPKSDQNDMQNELDKLFNYPLFHRELENKFVLGYNDWCNNYYKNIIKIDEYDIKNLCINYLEGFIWNLNYYFDKCICYDWHFKYSHGPTLNYLLKYLEYINKVKFINSSVYTPLEQLLLVLPPNSNSLLPINYQKLLTEFQSPIIEYYPVDFDIDSYYKRYYWESNPILPEININKVLNAIKRKTLTVSEQERNEIEDELVL